MGDNEKVQPGTDPVEVQSDNSSDTSDEPYSGGIYHFGGEKKRTVTLDNGVQTLTTFRANSKPAEKYYETIKSKNHIPFIGMF